MKMEPRLGNGASLGFPRTCCDDTGMAQQPSSCVFKLRTVEAFVVDIASEFPSGLFTVTTISEHAAMAKAASASVKSAASEYTRPALVLESGIRLARRIAPKNHRTRTKQTGFLG
jgi:hypothetical protein